MKVMFQGEDIKEKNLNLKLYTIQLTNDGSESIKQGDYDRELVWGLKINRARVVEARLSATTSEYLRQTLRLQQIGEDTISITKIILDPGQHAGITLLLLHNKDVEPSFTVLGKIAGIENIQIEKISNQNSEEPLFRRSESKMDLLTFLGTLLIVLVALGVIVGGWFWIFRSLLRRRTRIAESLLKVANIHVAHPQRGVGSRFRLVMVIGAIDEILTDSVETNARLLIATLFVSCGKRQVTRLLRDLKVIVAKNIEIFQSDGQTLQRNIEKYLRKGDPTLSKDFYKLYSLPFAIRSLARSKLVTVNEANEAVIDPILIVLTDSFVKAL